MAFIEPMHRNKPNITYLLALGPGPSWMDIQSHTWYIPCERVAVSWNGFETVQIIVDQDSFRNM